MAYLFDPKGCKKNEINKKSVAGILKVSTKHHLVDFQNNLLHSIFFSYVITETNDNIFTNLQFNKRFAGNSLTSVSIELKGNFQNN